MKPSDFKIGDRVLVDAVTGATYPEYKGLIGTIMGRNTWGYDGRPYYEVLWPEKRSHNFWDSQLELADDIYQPIISPQSPQPQQTQQKEDTVKPYAVIYQSLNSVGQGNIAAAFTTEAEAKEYAETTVAAQRANLTTKQYFAITIVNTKTGKLVGSVVDAPPAVDWATS